MPSAAKAGVAGSINGTAQAVTFRNRFRGDSGVRPRLRMTAKKNAGALHPR